MSFSQKSPRLGTSHWERQQEIGAHFSTIVSDAVEAFKVCGGPCLGVIRAGGRVTCLLPGRSSFARLRVTLSADGGEAAVGVADRAEHPVGI
jgi:hypothetical protein